MADNFWKRGQSASDLTILDSDENYDSGTVEGALQEAVTLRDEVTNDKRPGIDPVVIPHFIGEEYTNLIGDPTDLTSWGTTGLYVPVDTGVKVENEILWKVESNSTSLSYISASKSLSIDGDYVESIIFRKGNCSTCDFRMYDGTLGVALIQVKIDFDNKSTKLIGTSGPILSEKWLDDTTVQVYALAEDVDASNTISNNFVINTDGPYAVGDYVYMTQPQLVLGNTMYPFVDGTHEVDSIEVEQRLPGLVTIDTILEPLFPYNTTINNPSIFIWRASTAQRFYLYYEEASDKFSLFFQDGGSSAVLSTLQLDDGTTFTKLNQKMRFIVSCDLLSGGQWDSRFIFIPLEEGDLYEDAIWSTTPPVMVTDQPILSIGHSATVSQFNGNYEYLRIYDGLLVGDVNSSADADKLLQDKSMIFEAVPDAFVEREIKSDTEITTAIQNVYDDMKTGVGIRNEAILHRHLKDRNLFEEGIQLKEGRVSDDETTKNIANSSGWYVVAKTSTKSYQTSRATIAIQTEGNGRNGTMSCLVEHSASPLTRTHDNTTVKIVGKSVEGSTSGVTGFRIGVSPSASNDGAIIEAYINLKESNQVSFVSKIIGNLGGQVEGTGFELVTPYPSDGLLPDGVTSATYLEAGAELDLGNNGATRMRSGFMGSKIDDDTISVEVEWGQIPKQGSSMIVTAPGTEFTFRDGEGNYSSPLTAFTTGSFLIDGNKPTFRIIQTNCATSLNIGPLALRTSGTGFKLEIGD